MADRNAPYIQYTPLKVGDHDFHVTASIDSCPAGLMIRELLMNGCEAASLPEENGRRTIVIGAVEVDGAPKLSIWNTGHGMSADELESATDLAISIRKSKGLQGRQNRGEGAKVSSLPWNHCGVVIRSCREGQIHEVRLLRINDRYVKEKIEVDIPETGGAEWHSVWNVTEEFAGKSQYYNPSRDFTEVVLYGSTLEQDTLRWPYGEGRGSGHKRAVLTEAFDRFYDFPNHVTVLATDDLHGRKSDMEFRPIARVIERWKGEPEKLRVERIPIAGGVELEFVYTPYQTGSNNVMGRHELTGQSTRIALVWRGEMYDPQIGPTWRRLATGFGLPVIQAEVSVFIHLPDDFPVRDGAYRLHLYSNETEEIVGVGDWQSEIRSAIPDWLKKIVEAALAPKRLTDMSAVEKELAERLRRARLRLVPPGSGTGSKRVIDNPEEAETGSVLVDIETVRFPKKRPDPIPTVLDPDAPVEERPKPSAEKRVAKRPVRSVSQAPTIRWLDKEDQVAAESLHERAAKYEPAGNVLYLNALHASVVSKLDELREHYSSQVDFERANDLLYQEVRLEMALHIGTALVNALAKEGLRHWDSDDRARAFSPASLTVIADSSDEIVPRVRQKLAKNAAWQAAKLA